MHTGESISWIDGKIINYSNPVLQISHYLKQLLNYLSTTVNPEKLSNFMEKEERLSNNSTEMVKLDEKTNLKPERINSYTPKPVIF
jgi:hypothetical protein